MSENSIEVLPKCPTCGHYIEIDGHKFCHKKVTVYMGRGACAQCLQKNSPMVCYDTGGE